MPIVCPAILASTKEEYRREMEKVGKFAHRIQIDLTDGVFAQHQTVKPEDAWWPVGILADFHLMYKDPALAVGVLLQHRPHMIIMHAEAEGNFLALADKCRNLGIKAGVALLPTTQKEAIVSALDRIDHVLIFSGDLGNYGGHADMNLLDEVSFLKQIKPDLEVGWDGGINSQNIAQLAAGGIDVFNVGGFIQNSDDPEHAIESLQRIADETGTT